MKNLVNLVNLVNFVILFLVISCSEPTKEEKEGVTNYSSVNWSSEKDKENPPIKAKSSTYKAIKIITIPEKRDEFRNIIQPEKKMVEWGWIWRFRNLQDKCRTVEVTFILKDKDGFEIDRNTASEYVCGITPDGRDEKIISTSRVLYEDYKRVSVLDWSIDRSRW